MFACRSLLLFALAAPGVHAQAFTASYTPQQIVYKGAPEYKPADLTAVLGLQPNKPYTTADVDPALQRLADTGLFLDIRYTISNAALTFTLTPQPDKNMLPALYSNFVTFAPNELTPLVHAKVPLFTGNVPAAGSLQQSVQDALTAILHEHGFANATVESVASGSSAVSFSITSPSVEVRAVHVDGVSPEAEAKITEIEKAFVGSPYERGSEAAVQQRLRDAYQDLAFLDASVDAPTLSRPAVEPTRILVDLSTTVHQGAQYHVSTLTFPVSSIVPANMLAEVSSLKPGDPASRIMVLSTNAHLAGYFKHRGYMDAAVTAAQTRDASAHTVAYVFTAVRGEQYRVRAVHALNLNPDQQREFDAGWKLTPGSLYDAQYVDGFLHNNTALRSFAGYSATYKAAAYPDTHLVDLTITFTKGGVLR